MRKNTILQYIIKPLNSYQLLFSDIVVIFLIFSKQIFQLIIVLGSVPLSTDWQPINKVDFSVDFFSGEPSFYCFCDTCIMTVW